MCRVCHKLLQQTIRKKVPENVLVNTKKKRESIVLQYQNSKDPHVAQAYIKLNI